MNYPSADFETVLAAMSNGTATEDEVTTVHQLLGSNNAALDEYLWQMELHARLAETAATTPTLMLAPVIRWRKAAAIAAVLLLGAIVTYPVVRAPQKPTVNLIPNPALVKPAPPLASTDKPSPGALAGIYRKTVAFATAADAPIIIATGHADPIDLGTEVPYEPAGDTLHIWDWSKSPTSRVMKDTRLWPLDVVALSPNGQNLVWANGKVLNLNSGEETKIDLGGAFYFDNIGGDMQRIQRLEFTPDGAHLALRLCNVILTKSTHPLRKVDFETSRTIQIVTFPGAKLVCEFPAGLGMAFSQDGKRAAISLPEDKSKQQIVEHSAVTGEVLRKYEPHIREFAYAIAYSPDGNSLAAYDSAGELLIWNTITGELKRRVHLPNDAPGYLRFSHDSKLIAVSLLKGTSIIDVESGAFVARLRDQISGEIRWASDDKSFTLSRNVGAGTITERADKNGNLAVFNIFPAVQTHKLADLKP